MITTINTTDVLDERGIIKFKHSKGVSYLSFLTTKEFDYDISRYLYEKFNKFNVVYFPLQKHTDVVQIIEDDIPIMPEIADAVLTNKPNLFIGVKTADCVPIIIYDDSSQTIGVIHAGWRGTSKSIVTKTITKMITRFGAKTDNIMVIIGASIGKCCYEIDDDVFYEIASVTPNANFWTKNDKKKYQIDLQIANILQAKTIGIREENIMVIKECTYCLNTKYHSYRRDGKTAGRQYAIIGMVSS